MRIQYQPLLLLLTALLSSCGAGIGTSHGSSRVSQGQVLGRMQANAITGMRISHHSKRVLASLNLTKQHKEDPEATPALLDTADNLLPVWQHALAAAEISHLLGKKNSRYYKSKARSYYLDASISAFHGMFDAEIQELSAFDPQHQLLAQLYNSSLSRFYDLQNRMAGHPNQWTAVQSRFGKVVFQIAAASDQCWDSSKVQHFSTASTVELRGVEFQHRRYGFGASMTASQRTSIQGDVSVQPATLVMEPIKHPSGADPAYSAQLFFYKPQVTQRIDLAGRSLPLAGNFSVPQAEQLAKSRRPAAKPSPGNGVEPGQIANRHGLSLVDPYDPEKIPLLMVHGPWPAKSSWSELTKAVQADPIGRRHFQVWHFTYSSQSPLLINAHNLRKALRKVRLELDPAGQHWAMRNMVLVGHSTGGLLCKLMVQNSGQRVAETLYSQPIAQLVPGEAERQELSQILNFQAQPFVRRIIFMATPHQGSSISDSALTGELSALANADQAGQSDTSTLPADQDVGPSSMLDALPPGNGMVQTLSGLPMLTGLPLHSILGDPQQSEERGRNADPSGTDGAVPYWSSRLHGADSELIVPANHMLFAHPLTIQEVRRILHKHWKTVERIRRSL